MSQFLENSCSSIRTIYFTEVLYLAVSCRSHLGGPLGMRSLLWTIKSYAFCSVSSCDSRYLLAESNHFSILAVLCTPQFCFHGVSIGKKRYVFQQGTGTGVVPMFTLFATFVRGQYMFTFFSVLPDPLLLGYP